MLREFSAGGVVVRRFRGRLIVHEPDALTRYVF